MSAVTLDTISGQVAQLSTTVDRIKQERDRYEAALRDIIFGCDCFLQPGLSLTGAVAGFVKEIRRVASENL